MTDAALFWRLPFILVPAGLLLDAVPATGLAFGMDGTLHHCSYATTLQYANVYLRYPTLPYPTLPYATLSVSVSTS